MIKTEGMNRRKLRHLLRGARRANTNKSPETHVLVRKDSLQTILLEAYRMGKEDAAKQAAHYTG